jgi:hypothetical protein
VVITVVGVLGGLGLATGPLRRWMGGFLVTIAHEGGHAVAAVLCNHGRVTRIELFSHAGARRVGNSGLAYTRTFGRPAHVLVAAAGYPAPAALGLAVLALQHTGHGRGALAALVASLAVMLALVRNLFGVFLVFTVGAVLYLVLLTGPPAVQAAAVGVLAWTLLFGSVHDAVNLLRFGGGTHSDSANLAAMTGAKAEAWAALFALLTVAATGYAGWLTVTTWT